jgi:hypothetical protein
MLKQGANAKQTFNHVSELEFKKNNLQPFVQYLGKS